MVLTATLGVGAVMDAPALQEFEGTHDGSTGIALGTGALMYVIGVSMILGVLLCTVTSFLTLRRYPKDRHFGFDDLVLDLLDRGEPPASYAFEGFWLDIGRPDDYDRANAEFSRLRNLLLPGRAVRKAAVPA